MGWDPSCLMLYRNGTKIVLVSRTLYLSQESTGRYRQTGQYKGIMRQYVTQEEKDLDVLVNARVAVSGHCDAIFKKVSTVLYSFRKYISSRYREVLVPLCKAWMKLQLEG